MIISIDKATAVRMYDNVQKYWKMYLKDLQDKLVKCAEPDKNELEKKIKFMEETDMAVVVSQAQNEIEDFKKKGLDIAVHSTGKPGIQEKIKWSRSGLRWSVQKPAKSIGDLRLRRRWRNNRGRNPCNGKK